MKLEHCHPQFGFYKMAILGDENSSCWRLHKKRNTCWGRCNKNHQPWRKCSQQSPTKEECKAMKTNYKFCSKRPLCPNDKKTSMSQWQCDQFYCKQKHNWYSIKEKDGDFQPYSSDFSRLSQNVVCETTAVDRSNSQEMRMGDCSGADSSIQSHRVLTCSEHTDTHVRRAHPYCHSCSYFIHVHMRNMEV